VYPFADIDIEINYNNGNHRSVLQKWSMPTSVYLREIWNDGDFFWGPLN